MAENKKQLKKKLTEKRIEILNQIIEEEIDKAIGELLKEYDDYDYYGYGGSDYGLSNSSGGNSYGLGRFVDRSKFTGMLLSPAADIFNAFKKAGTKLGVNIASLIGTTIAGAITTLLPFTDPRVVKNIGIKMRNWEREALNEIDKEFAKETAQMYQGWETFKTDFWGIGFVASPFGAIASALTLGKGIMGALAVGDVITNGRIGNIINFIVSGKEKETEEKLEERFSNIFNKNVDIDSKIEAAIKNKQESNVSLADNVAKLKQIYGEKEAGEILKKVMSKVIIDPEAKKAEQDWVIRNLPRTLKNVFHDLNNEIKNNPSISPQEKQEYKNGVDSIVQTTIEQSIENNPKLKNASVPDAAIQMAKNAIQADTNKVLAAQ